MEIGYPTQHCNFMDFKYLTVFINFYWSYTVSLIFTTGNIVCPRFGVLGFKKFFLEHSLGVWKDGKVKSAYEPSGPSGQGLSWCR